MESLSAAYEHYTQYKEDQRRDVGYNKEVADFREFIFSPRLFRIEIT